MNNFRLSTNLRKELILTPTERDMINNASPTLERLLDGRLRELATGKVVLNRSNCVSEVIRPDGEVLILQSLKDALNILDVGFKRFKVRETWTDVVQGRRYLYNHPARRVIQSSARKPRAGEKVSEEGPKH